MQGLPIDNQHLDRDIYYLLVLFSASKLLAEKESPENLTSFRALRSQFEQSEATKQLISIAVCLRNFLDSNRNRTYKIHKKYLKQIVGKLKYGGKKQEDLIFREACNKIIHATDLEFKMIRTKQKDYILPTVYLYGEHGGVEWKATLNVLDFAHLAYILNF